MQKRGAGQLSLSLFSGVIYLRLRIPQRALPTETKVESGTFQSKAGTSVNLSNSGQRSRTVMPGSHALCVPN